MNKRGFTLVELLAVVIILALLIAFILPQITNSVRNYQSKTDELTTKLILEAAKLYVGDNSNKYSQESSTYCITMEELIENDYLKDKIKLNDEDVTAKKSVMVKYNTYKIVDNKECEYLEIVCTPVTGDNVTTGNIPYGYYEIGDEYVCEVKPGTKHHFFVIGTEGNKVNLIMNRNICEDGSVATESNTCGVSWASQEDYNDDANYGEDGNNSKGPITALKYLHNATKDWVNVYDIEMNYEDEGNDGTYGYGTIVTTEGITEITDKSGNKTLRIENLKARLPYYKELNGYNDTSLHLYDYLSVGPCNQPNPLNGINGYWNLSSEKNSKSSASSLDYGCYLSNFDVRYSIPGIRPVIEIDTNRFGVIIEPESEYKRFDEICTAYGNQNDRTIGSKFSCEVNAWTSYDFYVLKTPSKTDKSINLIMATNICGDGTAMDASAANSCYRLDINMTYPGWDSSNSNKSGPVTAMNFLYSATYDWGNIEPLNYEYYDMMTQGAYTYGYNSFISRKGILTITPFSGSDTIIGSEDYPLRARLPIYSPDKDVTEVADDGSSYHFLYNEISGGTGPDPGCEGCILYYAPYGYWTLSSSSDGGVWSVCYNNVVSPTCAGSGTTGSLGIRPVINIRL